MSDPPPLRLALPPDFMFEGTEAPPAAPPPPPTASPDGSSSTPIGSGEVPGDITTRLPRPDLFGIEFDHETFGRPDDSTGHDSTGHDPSGHDPVGHDSVGHDPTGHDPTGHDPVGDDDESEDGTSITGRRVRPYTITGGRTAVVGPEIPLEAQVLTSNRRPADSTNYRWETARLVEMVEVPMALVEVAARLEVPVGVARVLVSDLVTEGVLIIHLPPPASSFTSLLEQVLDGVRKL